MDWQFFKDTPETGEFRVLYPADQFREAMDRERPGADRWEQPLGALVVGCRQCQKRRRRTLKQVARILTRRLRLTDEAGWLEAAT